MEAMRRLYLYLKHGLRLFALYLGLRLSSQSLLAAVGFTLTPSTVSNTYHGILTLQITGLTSGESVVVQKFLDANTNDVIDGADLLSQQFQLTDGQASVIGGITNINVPGDTDPTPGQITARVIFRGGEPWLNFVGRYAYRISSPTGLFTSITNSFTISSAAYAQSLTGNVVNHGTNVPNAVVLVFYPPRPGHDGPGTPVAGAVANNSGSYTVELPSGVYLATAFKSEYLGNLAPLPVSVGSAATVVTNIILTNATRTISGKLADAATNSIGLPGLFVHAIAGGLAAIANSVPNGDFTLRVGPGQWGVGAEGPGILGYINLDSDTLAPVDTTTGSVSGLVIKYPKANALFFGSVRDHQNQPLGGIGVESANEDWSYWHDASTDDNGNYVAGALGGGSWNVDVNEEDPAVANYLFPESSSTNLSAGQAVRQDFTAILATNHISGHLRDNNSNPIPGVEIYAYAQIAGRFFVTGTYTDSGGSYSLNVANGTWTVGVDYGDTDDVLTGNYLPPPSQMVGVTNNDYTVNFTAVIASYRITGSVKDYANHPVPNLYVSALATIGGTNLVVWGWTDADGNYTLGVVNGNWNVWICCGCGNWPAGYCCPDSQTLNIANGDGIADFTLVQTGQIVITTSSPLPPGSVGNPYSLQFEAASCLQNLVWTATNPPPGLALSPWGELSGFPSAAGSNYFFVEVNDGIGDSTAKACTLIIRSGIPDVATYYVAKLSNYRQTNSVGVIPDSELGPYGALLGILQTETGLVSNASCILPTDAAKAFPPGNSELELRVHEAFAGESTLNAGYPSGLYSFEIHTADDGEQFSVLNLAATSFPDAPHVSNYAAAQTINPSDDFMLQWEAFSGGTAGDLIRLIVLETDASPVLKLVYPEAIFTAFLDSDATSATIPAGSLEANASYLGLLQFIRITDSNDFDYPGAVGVAVVSAQTFFTLGTAAAAPTLAQPTKPSSTQFRFLLTGVAGQNYTILKSTNLNSTNWFVLLVTNAPATSFFVLDASATNSRAFYRALSGP